MDRIIRISSQQSGNFTESNNMVSFQLPPRVIDMTGSYLQINASVVGAVGDPTKDNTNALWDFQVKYNGSNLDVNNVALVRRSQTRSNKLGVMEDRLRNDILEANLVKYTHSISQHTGEQFKSLIQPVNYTGERSNIFLEKVREGSVRSRIVRSVPINIPLSQLSSLGKMSLCPFNALGGGQLEFELQPQKFSLVADNVIPAVPAVVGAVVNTLIDNQPAPGGTGTEMGTDTGFVLTREIGNWDTADIPLYVGMPITITAGAGSTGTLTGADKEVSKITINKTTNKLTFFTTTTCGTLAAAEILQTIAWTRPAFVTAPTLSFTSAELVLKEVANPPAPPSDLTYTCFTTEILGVAGTSSLNHSFRLEPNCFNALLMLPDVTHDIISKLNALNTYRLSIDSIPVVNRSVSVAGGVRDMLHVDLITRALKLGGMRVGNTTEIFRSTAGLDMLNQFRGQTSTRQEEMVMIGVPTIRTDNSKLLQVELNATGNTITNLIVFKQLIKSVAL
tara:strand:+ start:2527 stop:4044 length:1518 start_codon:yes stop_codon:yes gene_type:complete